MDTIASLVVIQSLVPTFCCAMTKQLANFFYPICLGTLAAFGTTLLAGQVIIHGLPHFLNVMMKCIDATQNGNIRTY